MSEKEWDRERGRGERQREEERDRGREIRLPVGTKERRRDMETRLYRVQRGERGKKERESE